MRMRSEAWFDSASFPAPVWYTAWLLQTHPKAWSRCGHQEPQCHVGSPVTAVLSPASPGPRGICLMRGWPL